MTKKITIAIAILFVFVAQSQTIPLGTAINKAGKQRMLVQRMTKDYMSIGAGVKIEESTADIDDVTAMFNENQRDLVNFAKTQETKDALTYSNELWSRFRLKMASTPDVNNAVSIITEAAILTNACNAVVEKIVSQNTSSGNTKLTNTCGKQRLNLQRIAMLYIAKAWGVEYKFLDNDLKDAITSFDVNLSILSMTKENTPEINQSLAFQKSEWEFLKKSFENETPKPGSIFSSTNLMTKDFDILTGKYEKVLVESKIVGTK